jgi:hypothetical protein
MVVLEKIGIQLSFDNPANCHNLFLIDITGHTVLKKDTGLFMRFFNLFIEDQGILSFKIYSLSWN